MDNDEETITVPLSTYNRLIECGLLLTALHEAGVDNWEGYEEAQYLLTLRGNNE